MADWALLGSGFPPNATPLKLKPFYVATYTITDQNGTSTQTLQSFITVQ